MNRLVLCCTKFPPLLSTKIKCSMSAMSKFMSIQRPKSTIDIKRFIQLYSVRYQMPKTPDLIYMPQVIRWIKSKLRFKYLKKLWDPEFSEGAFIYGSTKAVCRITEIISSGKLEELDGLMTVSAKLKLEDDVNYRLNQIQKQLIVLKPEDIKILVPITVTLSKQGIEKTCRIGLRVLGLKWHVTANDNYKLVLVALQTEFSRDYTDKATSEWIVSGFSILECTMLTEATPAR